MTVARIALLAPALALMTMVSVAHAQTDDSEGQQKAEVTPFVSLGSASSGVGAAVRWPVGANFSIELETAYRRAEVNGVTSNVSLLFDLPRVHRITPYLAGGVGLEQYGVAIGSPQLGIVTRSQTALTVNAGGGLRVPVDENWGVRTDARWFNGLGKAPERWRVYNGVTFGTGTR